MQVKISAVCSAIANFGLLKITKSRIYHDLYKVIISKVFPISLSLSRLGLKKGTTESSFKKNVSRHLVQINLHGVQLHNFRSNAAFLTLFTSGMMKMVFLI